MKGVVLAAGKGTRLYPLTKSVPKPLLGVYDRPMIYFALEFMKSAKVDEVMVIVSKDGEEIIKKTLGNGEEFGLNISYQVQEKINGTAGAIKEVAPFIQENDILLYYSDNLLLGKYLDYLVEKGIQNVKKGYATILATEVDNPENYGVVEVDQEGVVLSIEEKPKIPKSSLASPGIYFYPSDMLKKVMSVGLSERGEYEMTEVNEMYLSEGRLRAIKIKDDTVWKDVGSFERLLEASEIVAKMCKEKDL